MSDCRFGVSPVNYSDPDPELSAWLFTCAVFVLVPSLNCRCPFPVWCLGQDVEFDCIGS